MCKGKTCNLKSIQLNQVVVTIIICFYWCLLAIPIAFFYFPSNESNSSSECNTTMDLEDSPCYEALHSHSKNINFSAALEQVLVAKNASSKLEQYFENLMVADNDCLQVLVPFLCAYYHGGVCNELGTLYPTNTDECVNISTGVCQELWSKPELRLPECDRLDDTNRKFKPLIHSVVPNKFTSLNVTSNRTECPAVCADRFFCDTSTNTCVPSCPDWNIVPLNIVALGDIMILSASVLGLLTGLGVIIVSIIRRKMIFTFPSVLVVYETISILIHSTIQIITFFDREELYCSSSSVLESAMSATPYCILSGMIQAAYIPLQFNIWWVCHMFILFWTVRHPFEARKSSTKNKFLRIHIIIVIIGILVPIIPIIGIIIYDVIQPYEYGRLGFGLIQSPPLFCTASNSTSYFYFIQFPNAVLLILGLTGLTLTIWTVQHKYGIVKSIKDKKKSPVTTAEIKLMIIVFYFILLGVVHFTGTSQTPDTQLELELYFECEQNGVDPNNPCSRSGFESPYGLIFFTISYSLALLIPAVNLLFVVDLRTIRAKARKILKKRQKS